MYEIHDLKQGHFLVKDPSKSQLGAQVVSKTLMFLRSNGPFSDALIYWMGVRCKGDSEPKMASLRFAPPASSFQFPQ